MMSSIDDILFWRDFGGPNEGRQMAAVVCKIDLFLVNLKWIQTYEFVKLDHKR
jgi:hypothetical protein